ncbi:FtsX-like permease family protein [Amycolatopsis sp. H20-H5]|uniref:FtsX-like permease family protein n=1 Tax=Amycolatopsis sp. H20-H5 TaxID=3046309 RepID=UPI002DBF064F|nr:FtsX-like permease family protein [Amycolatopsis sp. H20-H5]MEC3976866.1 FtsX-like permease family protein [Amycolatopsis sp. H20-H5]
MIRDFALGLRLAVGGGRISGPALLRLAMTTFGIALAVAVLLPAASFGNLMDKRADRSAANLQVKAEAPGVAPLLVMRGWSVEFHDHYVNATAVAPTGPTSPVPTGLDRVPAPGELVVSPAVQEILNSPLGTALRARLPGTIVGLISKTGVTDPGDLLVFAGARPDQLTDEKSVTKVYGFGGSSRGFEAQATLLLFLAPASVVLLLPLLVFVTTASRMGAAQRDRRLAALRLIGLDARQVRRVAAGESLVGAVAGLVVGIGLFLVLRSQIGKLDLFGLRVYGEDFVPAWPLAALIAVLVPALAIGAALFGLRRTIVEPLGVVRIGKPQRRQMWWRWTILALGAMMLISTLFAEKKSSESLVVVAITAGSALSLIGVATVLPWAVERLVRTIHGGAPSWQLAIRRLQLDSGTASRVVSGLVVVLAGAILIQALVAALGASDSSQSSPSTLGTASVQVSTRQGVAEDAVQRARAVSGITAVQTLRGAFAKPGNGSSSKYVQYVQIGDCAALALRAKLPSCTDGAAFYVDPNPQDRYRAEQAAPAGVQRLSSSSQDNESTEGTQWTVPDSLRHIPAANAVRSVSGDLLLTPGALGGAQIPGALPMFYISGNGTPNEVADRVGAALSPLAWQASISTIDGSDFRASSDRISQQIRSTLLFVSVFVLSIAALSLLLLSVEQITERRRPLAALSASGVPISVLAKGLLWQTAIPVGVGVVLAVATGIGVTAPILRMADLPYTFDGGGIAILIAAAVLAVLLVTAATWPLLRSVTRLDGLRAE